MENYQEITALFLRNIRFLSMSAVISMSESEKHQPEPGEQQEYGISEGLFLGPFPVAKPLWDVVLG